MHKNKQDPDAPYPVFNGGIANTGFYHEYNRTANKIIISARGANAGYVNRVFTNFWSGNSCYTIEIKDKSIDWNFLYYWLKSKEKKLLGEQQKGGIPAVSKKQVELFLVPVPPLEVQREIVRVLDNFTELTTELTARKKQYEYYRDQLLKFGDEVGRTKLAEVAEIFDSLHQTPHYSEKGYSMVRVQDVKAGYIDLDFTRKVNEEVFNQFVKKYRPQRNDIVVSRVGSYGNFALIPNDCCCIGQNVAIIHSKILPKFLYYVLNSSKTKQWIDKNVKVPIQKSFS